MALPATALGGPRAGDVTDARLRAADQDPGNWLTHGGGWQELRYSKLTGINAGNVNALKPAWSTEFDTTRGQESDTDRGGWCDVLSTAWSKV